MKAPTAKGKITQLDRSRSSHRATGPATSYLQTRVRGSRLYEAAFILAIAELTRRLHQAYQHAYDKHAVDWVLPQNTGQTPTTTPNPNCITNAVSGATGLARPFGNVGPTGIIGHDGVHVVAPVGSQVTTLPALTGTVLGRPRNQGDGLFAQDVLLAGGNVAIYKDLATVSVRPGQRLRAGSVIGTVGEGGDYAGLHFSLLRGGRNERNFYRGLTSTGQSNKITVGMFINPLGPNSPVNCPGVPVNNAGVNPHP